MAKFWEAHKEILSKYRTRQAARARELAVKHFRATCPVGRMAARLNMAIALRHINPAVSTKWCALYAGHGGVK